MSGDLIPQRRRAALARPAVGEELDHAQSLARLDVRGDRDAAEVVELFGRTGVGAGRALDDVIHASRHPQPTRSGGVHQHDPRAKVGALLGAERRDDAGADGDFIGRDRERLVGDQLRLHDEARRAAERLELVADGCDGELHERDEAYRRDAYRLTGWRDPLDTSPQDAGAKIERSLVAAALAEADVEGLIVDVQPDDLAVRDVDHRLPRLREAIAGLRVGQRA